MLVHNAWLTLIFSLLLQSGASAFESSDLIENTKGEVYQLQEWSGQGSYGTVFKALKPSQPVEYAVKLFSMYLSSGTLREVLDSNRLFYDTCGLDSCGPHLLGMHEMSIFKSDLKKEVAQGLVMPWATPIDKVKNLSLSAVLSEKDVKAESILSSLYTIAVITNEVYRGLAELRRHNLSHNDVKPSNIVIFQGVAALTDYDFLSGEEQKTELRIGTYTITAPEIFDGIRLPKSDLFSLGITTFNLLTNRAPQDHFPGFEDANAFGMQDFYRQIYEQHANRFRQLLCQDLADLKTRISSAIGSASKQQQTQIMALYDRLALQVKDAARISYLLRKWSAVPKKLIPKDFQYQMVSNP